MFDGSIYIEHEDDYPLGELPIGICAAVEEVKRITQAPLALVVASALASAATACQGLADVQRPTIPGAVPLSIFFAVANQEDMVATPSLQRSSSRPHFGRS